VRKRASGSSFAFFLCLLVVFFLAGSAYSDTINYVYDNLGRLVMTVTSNGLKIIYGYDQAGHVVSVTRTSVNQQPPLITGITPQSAFIGTDASITISGSNLLTTDRVTTDNPGIRIVNYSATNDSVTIDAQISNSAVTGTATFKMTTTAGSASVSLNLLNITMTPARIALAPGASGTITVNIDGLQSDYSLVPSSQSPDIVSVPQSLTVPVAGTATLTIDALSQGNSVITAGSSAVSVYVTAPFIGTGTVSSPLVSVQTGFAWGSDVYSPLVSVKIGQ
jgi:YD repeat-containing protein